MIVTSPLAYENFKLVVMGLGFNKKTPVLAYDDGAGTFQAFVSFGPEQIAILFGAISRPSTFDADFPQAVYSDSSLGSN